MASKLWMSKVFAHQRDSFGCSGALDEPENKEQSAAQGKRKEQPPSPNWIGCQVHAYAERPHQRGHEEDCP